MRVIGLVFLGYVQNELIQCRRAAKGCMPPLPDAGPNRRMSKNPTDLANIFGPSNRHPPALCNKGGCAICALPAPCENTCKYKDKFIPVGQSFLPRKEDPCRTGTCLDHYGTKEIKFNHEKCKICPKDCIQQPAPGKCCPTCDCGPATPEMCPPVKTCPFLSCPLKDQFTPYQKCCPECKYCIDQWGKNNYNHNEQWWYYDEKCTCNRGKIECTTPRGPDNPFIGKSCSQPVGEKKPHGAEWQDPRDKCKLCDCDNGKTVCSKRCPSKQCKNGQILGRTYGNCCPVCIDNPNTCLAYGRGHLMTVDGNVTNIENCIYTLMSNCQDPTDVGMSGSVTGRGPITGYDPPVQSYNGDYIPSLSSQYYEDSLTAVDPDYYENYPSEYKRRRTTKHAGMKKRCRDKNSGNMVQCNDTRAAERDQTTWTVQTQPDKLNNERAWSVQMVTDEKGDTAGVIINIGRKMVAEVLKWNDLRINGVKMHLPFENSEMVAEVFCGLVQITTNVGFAVTMDKDGQVECSAPDNTEENTPVHVPESWIKREPDRNDGNCEEPTDCTDQPFCQNHPKCDPKCKGDGCNHPECKTDPRCPHGERDEIPPERIRNKCNPLDPNDKNCDWSGPLENPNNGLCGACNYPQRVNPQCIVPPSQCNHPRARTQAHKECAIIKGPGFAPCHEVIHPDPFYHACIQDRCRNFGRKPVCEIFNAYDLECNRANVLRLKWRPETTCHKVCPAPFIWSDCGKPCDETCDDPAPACFGKCVPGCRCAAGYVFHDGDCIKPERCPSYVKPEKKKNPFKCIDW